MARKLVLLTYNVRPDADPEEYAHDTRTVDYPVFRERPSVLGYSNFLIVKNEVGQVPFQRFDLLWVSDFADLQKDIWGDPKVKKHTERWFEKWSVEGPSASGLDDGANHQASFAEEIWG